MKLPLLLALAASLLGSALAKTTFNWKKAECDKKVGATTPETCCKTPPFEHWLVSLVAPQNGTCVEYSDTLPLTFQAIESQDKNYTEPEGPAFLLYLIVNLPEDSAHFGENVLFTVPACFGDGSEPTTYYYLTDGIERFETFKYSTWSFNLVSMPNATDWIETYAFSGATNSTGIWISKDCSKLKDDICDGKVTEPSLKKNPFYKEAMTGCGKGGGGGSGGGGGAANKEGGKGSRGKGGGGSGGRCNKDKRSHGHGSKHKC